MSTTSDKTYYYEKQCKKNLKKLIECHRAVTKGRPGARNFPGLTMSTTFGFFHRKEEEN